MFEKDVERRYQSARDLLVDLRNLKRDSDANAVQPAAVADVRRHNLLGQLTTFVGRVKERAEVQRLLFSTRLLTMTGAGGCGKTRLALRSAAEVLDQFKDGVWFVDLAPLVDVDLVPQTVATVLGIRKLPQHSFTEALSAELAGQQLLLVMDNCEHLIDATAQLVETLLRAAPQLRILATSREALGVPGETVWRVPSLSVPDPNQPVQLESVLEFEAARLFVDRAVAVDPAFAVTGRNVTTIAEVCHRLDGIPLAIELAAARLNVLSLDQINSRLKDRFRLLTGGSRTAVARQRTLEATVDWSYELLAEPERRLLCRLSIFPAGWTLEAAEEVCSCSAIRFAGDDMLDHLSRLVDKSLVSVEAASEVDPAAGRRYRFLDTVRQSGRERLLRAGESEMVRDRHLAYFTTMVQRVEPELGGADQVLWLNRLQILHDDFRSALDWGLATPGRSETALELVAALWWFWTKRGYFSEGRQRLERALAAASHSSPGLRARALIGLSHLTMFEGDNDSFEGDNDRTMVLLDECLALAREAGDFGTMALTLGFQALTAAERGDFERSGQFAAEGLTVAPQSGDPRGRALSLRMLGYVAVHASDYEQGEYCVRGVHLPGPTGWRAMGTRHPARRPGGIAALAGPISRCAGAWPRGHPAVRRVRRPPRRGVVPRHARDGAGGRRP